MASATRPWHLLHKLNYLRAAANKAAHNLPNYLLPTNDALQYAFHFLSSQEGDTEDGNQTKQQYIQDTYVMNLAKLDDLEDHMVKYDSG